MRDADGRRAPTGRRRSTGASGGRRAYAMHWTTAPARNTTNSGRYPASAPTVAAPRAAADVPDHRGAHRHPRAARRQGDPGPRPGGPAARDRRRPPAVPLCRPADEPRQQGAPRERQRDRHTQARGGQAELAQVDGERDPEKAVAERPHGLRDEDRSDLRLTNGRHVLSISSGGGVPMNPVERVLYRELAELLDRLAASVPEGSLEHIRASTL